jgi:hypothetical protein
MCGLVLKWFGVSNSVAWFSHSADVLGLQQQLPSGIASPGGPARLITQPTCDVDLTFFDRPHT